ncbi:MAG: shikimate kinase [Candidatus Shikimatogenerans bostrichidophilus]|nr:MAG: shikimate kinase [Candidatus Shikimatogenerans bostrichidophilus]
MKIILIGYMGSGKTLIGSILSFLTYYPMYDLDNIINQIYNLKINNIFYKIGEYKFRIIENIILNFFFYLKQKKAFILSVGGGTPCFFSNIKKMNKIAKTIYLKTNNFILFNRLLKDNKNRPIINNSILNKKLYLFINKNIIFRNYYYKQTKYIIKTKNINFINLAEYIKKKINI